MFLYLKCYAGHCLNSLKWVCPACCLSTQHNCICALENCIGNICNLCTCRSWMLNHCVKHLGCNNDRLLSLVALFYNVVLNYRNLLIFDFHSEISSGYHYSVAVGQYFVYVVNSLLVLYLGYDFQMAVFLIQDSLYS